MNIKYLHLFANGIILIILIKINVFIVAEFGLVIDGYSLMFKLAEKLEWDYLNGGQYTKYPASPLLLFSFLPSLYLCFFTPLPSLVHYFSSTFCSSHLFILTFWKLHSAAQEYFQPLLMLGIRYESLSVSLPPLPFFKRGEM